MCRSQDASDRQMPPGFKGEVAYAASIGSAPGMIKCIGPGHIDRNRRKPICTDVKKIAVGLAGQPSVQLGVFHLELRRDPAAMPVGKKPKIMMSDRAVALPKPVEHGAYLRRPLQPDRVGLDGEYAICGQCGQHIVEYLAIDSGKIASDQGDLFIFCHLAHRCKPAPRSVKAKGPSSNGVRARSELRSFSIHPDRGSAARRRYRDLSRAPRRSADWSHRCQSMSRRRNPQS